MISVEKIFGNFLNSPLITPDRLLLFAKDNLIRLTKANTNKEYDTIIGVLTNVIAVLEGEVTTVDTTMNLQSGQTDTVNTVTSDFHHTLSSLEGVIANSVGGIDSIPFKEFYPHGVSEYGLANRTTMPMLTTRVKLAATKYATQLGVPVTTKLQGYQAEYVTVRNSQSTSIANLSTNRGVKSVSVFNV